uniref:Uncharacterized protein n=1 Tax=Denticeps clupeoides TaxID=299321 RepID=A0AAY4CJ53_9TELE
MGSEDEQRSNCKLEQSESEDFHRSDSRRIEGCLSQAKTSCLGCQELLLPRSLSADEPCGVRGALVRLFLLEATDALQELGHPGRGGPQLTPPRGCPCCSGPDVDSWPRGGGPSGRRSTHHTPILIILYSTAVIINPPS